MTIRYLTLAVLLSSCAAPAALQETEEPAAPQAVAGVNREAQLQKEFLDGVGKYLEIRKAEEKKIPALSDEATPEEIAAHQTSLLRAMQRARRGAKQGEIFTPASRAMIRRLLAGPDPRPGTPERSALQEDDPGPIKIAINGPYPTTVPLPTVPPQVLTALPRLPDEQIEFRFMGTRLILLDARANMIVDYMDRALPR